MLVYKATVCFILVIFCPIHLLLTNFAGSMQSYQEKGNEEASLAFIEALWCVRLLPINWYWTSTSTASQKTCSLSSFDNIFSFSFGFSLKFAFFWKISPLNDWSFFQLLTPQSLLSVRESYPGNPRVIQSKGSCHWAGSRGNWGRRCLGRASLWKAKARTHVKI